LNLFSEEEAAEGDCKLIKINHELQDNHESQSLVASDPSPPKLMVCEEERRSHVEETEHVEALLNLCFFLLKIE
jgi:hypothetical protein